MYITWHLASNFIIICDIAVSRCTIVPKEEMQKLERMQKRRMLYKIQ